jgi:hypothetical protein
MGEYGGAGTGEVEREVKFWGVWVWVCVGSWSRRDGWERGG